MSEAGAAVPTGWDGQSHAAWLQGDKGLAIERLLVVLNASPVIKPLPQVLQLAYYLFLRGDPKAAAHFLGLMEPSHPEQPELLRNLAVCLSRSGQYAAAVERLQRLIRLQPDDYVALDSLAHSLYQLGRLADAQEAGTRSLTLKDRLATGQSDWAPPSGSPAQWLSTGTRADVIAFSLWGSNPRYLRGALDNVLTAQQVYPGWRVRFYLDGTVPSELKDVLAQCGAQLVHEAPDQPDRLRLAWRFKVANDPRVARFLVRDVDAVVNARESAAVAQWVASDTWFHVMRDWWTHTDVMLAGMWGGVAGVLPPLQELLQRYRPPNMETPNVDQWFLRDCVWHMVRQSSLVHDRFFTPEGATTWPADDVVGNGHVGQDMFAVQSAAQAERLAPWLQRLNCLQ